jgi:hypothetical protein
MALAIVAVTIAVVTAHLGAGATDDEHGGRHGGDRSGHEHGPD